MIENISMVGPRAGTARRIAQDARRAAQDDERKLAHFVEATWERRNLPQDHPSRSERRPVGLLLGEQGGNDVIRFVDGPSGGAFRLDKGFVDIIRSLKLERFYACTGDHSQPACHIDVNDLMGFIREARPHLVDEPRLAY